MLHDSLINFFLQHQKAEFIFYPAFFVCLELPPPPELLIFFLTKKPQSGGAGIRYSSLPLTYKRNMLKWSIFRSTKIEV
jgi:hypothetical protein